MAQLNTRLVLRNDTSAAWLENSHKVLAKGELGIEFSPAAVTEAGLKADYKVRIKVGDGVSTWAELPYFGDSVEFNEKAFAMIEGKLDLLGLAAAEVGAQLVKGADGSISWVKPDTTTVESLSTTVEQLVATINGTVDESGNPKGDGLINRVATLESKGESDKEADIARDEKINKVEETLVSQAKLIEQKADADKVYTKEEANAAIASAVVEAGHLKRVIISKEELATLQGNPVEAEKNVIYMVKINALLKDAYEEYMRFDSDLGNISFERIGDTSVDLEPYAKKEELTTAVGSVEAKVEELGGQVAAIKGTVEKLPEQFISKDEAASFIQYSKYEVTSKPAGTLVDVSDEEIRVMCPADTDWQLQNSGENANPNMYYIGLKAYAPDDSIYSFKEDLAEIISDQTMYYFENNEFAGVDKNGRKYSIVWLPVALYDGQSWTYYGASSSSKRYIGWYYSVEWYNKDGLKVASDTIRINLSNENCHNIVEPYYMGSINVNKLVQSEDEFLILYGGSATDNI